MAINTTSIESDFLAARAKTAITIMQATGWNESIVNPGALGLDSIFFYVFDYQTKWTWCCSVPKEAFFDALKQFESIDHCVSIACCCQMIAECAVDRDLNPEKEKDLAIALSAYISVTRSYQLTERATKQNHFAVIRYGLTDTIRPFAMVGPSRYLISADLIGKSMQQVIAMDSQNHPEWIIQ